MRNLLILCIALVNISCFAAAAPLQAKDERAIIDFVQSAVVRALDYRQGDRQSLMDAQDAFTADGWREFMKRMDRWLDPKGAPLGSSSFMQNGDAVIKDQANGSMHLVVPGVLRQSQNQSVTTYRLVIDVRVDANAVKITHFEPIVELKK